MDIKRNDTNLKNLIQIALTTIKVSLRYNEDDNAKAILLNLYKEGYRDGCIDTILEQKNKEKE